MKSPTPASRAADQRVTRHPQQVLDYELGTSLWQLIERRARLTPEGILAVDEQGRRITFGDYRERVESTAAGLFQLGMRPGDVVSWILPTWIEATVITGALDRLGAVQNPMLHIYRDREVSFITQQLSVRWLIVCAPWRGHDYAGDGPQVLRQRRRDRARPATAERRCPTAAATTRRRRSGGVDHVHVGYHR